jgi:DNA polymerase-3 subunit alpha
MNNTEFHHLHLHTEYSIDAIGTLKDYVQHAVNLGMRGMAMTDHANMDGIVDAVNSAKMIDPTFKIIAGCEIYLYVDNHRFHLTLIGDGLVGYNNIVRIINAGNLRQIKLHANKKELRYNRVIIDDLIAHNEGVYLLTGCPASILQKESINGAVKLVEKLKPFYGERIIAEGMLSSDEDAGNSNHVRRAMELSQRCNINFVISNDVHRPKQTQIHAHRRYANMNFPMYIKDEKTGKMIDKSVVYKDLYLTTGDQMIQMCYEDDGTCKYTNAEMAKIQQGIAFSNTIVDKLKPMTFSGSASLPYIPNAKQIFKDKVYDALAKYQTKNPHLAELAKQRVDFEYKIISDKDYETYFLLVQEFVSVGKKFGAIGKGRGSAAGSLISMLLNITGVDPLEWNLIFERFLDPNRTSMPDIDIDNSEDARDAIIEYAIDKYEAMPIVTHARYSEASLINDLFKYYKGKITQHQADMIKDAGDKCVEFQEVCANIPEFKSVWENLLHAVHHTSSHAGGIVIIPKDAETLVPTVVDKKGRLLVGLSEGGSGQDLADAGGVKIDILGSTTLTAVDIMGKLTGVYPPKLAPDEYDDCFELLNDKADISGVFQLTGGSAKAVAHEMSTKSISDIVIITSISRTGALDSGTKDQYIKRVQKAGHPYVIACSSKESVGKLLDLEFDSGLKLTYPSNYSIKLTDGTFVKIDDLNDTMEIDIK